MSFLIRRFFRIYPAYWVCLLLYWFCFLLYYGPSHLPSLKTLLWQASLFGFFNDTPLALAGVEWTLRVEIMFYTVIFIGKCIFKGSFCEKYLYPILLISILLPLFLKPFPGSHFGFGFGYVNLFWGFLSLGSAFYFYDKGKISGKDVAFLCALHQVIFWFQLPFLSRWLIHSHFSSFGILLFLISIKYQKLFSTKYKIIKLLSSLSYLIYLSHNWMWQRIPRLGLSFPEGYKGLLIFDLYRFIVLIFLCFVIHIIVEKPLIKIGRKYSSKFGS